MEKVRLKDICQIVSGTTPKTNIEEYWDGDIDWITPAELNEDSYIIEESVRKITELAVKKSALKAFPKGTVILSSRAPIGKVAIAGKEMYCNQGFKNLICSDKVSSFYLYWFLKGKTAYLNSLGRGATFKEISKSIVENIEIPLPGLEVQAEISNRLKKCTDIIRLRKKQIEELDKLVKSQFIEMFGEVEETEKVIELFSYVSRGKSPNYVDESSVKVVNQACIYWNELKFEKTKLQDADKITKDRLIQQMDLLLNSTGTGTLGRCNVFVNPDQGEYIADSHVTILRPKKEFVNPYYFKYFIQQDKVQNEIYRKCVNGSTNQIELSKDKLLRFDVVLPPIGLQNKFASFVQQVEKQKFIVQQSLEETRILFDALMQKYFG